LAEFGQAVLLDEGDSKAAWAAIRDAAVLPVEEGEAVWRVSVRPSSGPAILDAMAAQGGRGYLDWGGGLAMLAGPALEATHQAIANAVSREGGIWTMLRAPAPLRCTMTEPDVLRRLAGRVKSVLDPRGVLNPGRL
jgi:glycolate oxidase FAD binding subunit